MTWNGTLLAVNMTLVLVWSLLVVMIWAGWTTEVANLAISQGTDPGLSVLITTGCSGGCWVVGLVPIALFAVILRR